MNKLEKINNCLKTFNMPVYYGKSFCKPNDKWNYIVFNRQAFNKSGTNKNDYNYFYQVHIIQEHFIEEGLEVAVIETIKEQCNLKFTGQAQYNYVTKNDSIIVEMLTLQFTKSVKGCALNG